MVPRSYIDNIPAVGDSLSGLFLYKANLLPTLCCVLATSFSSQVWF